MYSRENTFKTTLPRMCGERRAVKAEYGMHWIQGNRRPYFSITGTTYRVVAGVGFESGGEQFDITKAALISDGGGCVHDDIAIAFPELAELIPFHLCDDDGPSMHYVANGIYWAELELGVSRWMEGTTVPHGYASFWDVVKKHTLTDQVGDEDAVYAAMHGMGISITNGAGESGRKDFGDFLTSRIPAMKAVFDAMMAKHQIKMIEVPVTPV